MSNIQAMAGAGVGHVRAVFSGRCRGFAAPLDLVRVHLRAVVRSGVRRRLAAEFGGYLVTDAGPAVVPLFSARRWLYEAGFDWHCMTGAERFLRVGFGRVFDFPIDAPELIAAGSMWSAVGDCEATQSAARRWREERRGCDLPETLEDSGPVGVDVPVWRDSAGRVVRLGGVVYAQGLRDEFRDCHAGYLLDASDYLPTGSTQRYVSGGEACAGRGQVMRAGWFE